MIRAFLALPVPGAVASTLVAAQATLPVGNPVEPENFHITLAFLGEHPEDRIEDLHYELQTVPVAPFELRIRGVDLLGNRSSPKLLYAGVEPEPALLHLRKTLARRVRELGFQLSGERYLPHVTLARFRRPMDPEDREALQDYLERRMSLTAGPFTVDGFALYRSHLRKRGAGYEVLAEYG